MTEQPVLNLNNFSEDAQRVFLTAMISAVHRFGHNFLSAEHFLWAVLDHLDTNAFRILETLRCNQTVLRSYLTQSLRQPQPPTRVLVQSGSFSLPLSSRFGPILNKAQEHAQRSKAKKIGTDHLLLAMTEVEPTSRILKTAGITSTRVANALKQIHKKKRGEPASEEIIDLLALLHGKRKLPFVARSQIVNTLLATLLDHNQPGVLLVGEEGSSRWFQVLGLADELRRMSKRRRPFGLIAINPETYLNNPVLTIQEALTQARKTKSVLVVPHLNSYLDRTRAADYLSAGELLKRELTTQGVKLLGVTTPSAYRQTLQPPDPTFSRLPVVRLAEADRGETLRILETLAPLIIGEHKVSLKAADLDAAVELADRFLPGVLPGKAIALFSAACAEVRRAKLTGPESDGIVDETDLALVVERQTGIPIGKMVGPERERLAAMEAAIHTRYVNQEHAVKTICRAVRHGRSAFKDPNRPIGAFLFLGPTGVGKTELAKALAEFLFGSEDTLIVINMTEYQERHTVSALLGAPAGYVGYGETTQLTAVRERPYSVVLLDEFGKAHQEVELAFMQAIEEGFLTDRQGNRIDFRHTIIIMTTNVGTEYLRGADFDAEKERALAAVKQHFRPELLNRIDAQVVFKPLTPDDLVQILNLMLRKTALQASQEGLQLNYDQISMQRIVAELWDQCKEYGARPLRRVVDDLEQTITDQLVQGKIRSGDTLDISLQDDKIGPVRR